VSPNFTLELDSVADSNYREKCDVGGFLIFEWTLVMLFLGSLEVIHLLLKNVHHIVILTDNT
jgi:hypothetical protein